MLEASLARKRGITAFTFAFYYENSFGNDLYTLCDKTGTGCTSSPSRNWWSQSRISRHKISHTRSGTLLSLLWKVLIAIARWTASNPTGFRCEEEKRKEKEQRQRSCNWHENERSCNARTPSNQLRKAVVEKKKKKRAGDNDVAWKTIHKGKEKSRVIGRFSQQRIETNVIYYRKKSWFTKLHTFWGYFKFTKKFKLQWCFAELRRIMMNIFDDLSYLQNFISFYACYRSEGASRGKNRTQINAFVH